MTPQENLKDIMDKRILKTKMYSFNEVREMFELERQKIKKSIKKIEPLFNEMTRNFDLINKKEVLALLDNDSPPAKPSQTDGEHPVVVDKDGYNPLNRDKLGESRKGKEKK